MTNSPDIIFDTAPEPTHAIVWLHGLGADGNDFVPIAKELDIPNENPVRFIFPHAPVQAVTLNAGMKMRAWFDILGLDRNSNQDDAGIRKSEMRIQAIITNQIDQGIPAENIFIAGFSQGGALALHSGLRYPKKLAGIIALSTYLPLADLVEAERHAENHETPIFFAHGELDPIIPLDFAETSRDTLQSLNHAPAWKTYPMAHSVCADEISDLRAWLLNIVR